MKTLEDKARIAREKVLEDLKRAYEKHKDIQHYATASACIEMYGMGLYLSGANEAISSQWRSVEDELPKADINIEVLILRPDHTYRKFDVAVWDGEDWYTTSGRHIRPTHWMPIPGLPDTKQS